MNTNNKTSNSNPVRHLRGGNNKKWKMLRMCENWNFHCSNCLLYYFDTGRSSQLQWHFDSLRYYWHWCYWIIHATSIWLAFGEQNYPWPMTSNWIHCFQPMKKSQSETLAPAYCNQFICCINVGNLHEMITMDCQK